MRSLQDRLHEGRPLLGTFTALGCVHAIELACRSGFDFVVVDAQHGLFDLGTMREALLAIESTNCLPIARIEAHTLGSVEALLDAGYMTLIAPMVNTPEQARAMVEATHYPPRGQRSHSACRAGLIHGDERYRERFNDAFGLLVMIEHIDAVRRIEAIVAEPGVGGCFLGLTDLRSSIPEHEDPAALDEAVRRVRDVTLQAGKTLAIATRNIEAARRYADEGFHLVTVGSDRRLLHGAFAIIPRVWSEHEADDVK